MTGSRWLVELTEDRLDRRALQKGSDFAVDSSLENMQGFLRGVESASQCPIIMRQTDGDPRHEDSLTNHLLREEGAQGQRRSTV